MRAAGPSRRGVFQPEEAGAICRFQIQYLAPGMLRNIEMMVLAIRPEVVIRSSALPLGWSLPGTDPRSRQPPMVMPGNMPWNNPNAAPANPTSPFAVPPPPTPANISSMSPLMDLRSASARTPRSPMMPLTSPAT